MTDQVKLWYVFVDVERLDTFAFSTEEEAKEFATGVAKDGCTTVVVSTD